MLVRVKDSRTEFAPECINRIFAAFYTTKSTGLGHGAFDLPLNH